MRLQNLLILKHNKFPGNDGLTAEFHIYLSNELFLILLNNYDSWETFGTMVLFLEQESYLSCINLDYKNLNYKIYSTVLKNRMQKTLDATIGENQSATIINRTILHIFSTIRDVTDVSNKLNSNLALIFFMLLGRFVLSEVSSHKFILLFVSLVMETNIQSKTKINGLLSDHFTLV